LWWRNLYSDIWKDEFSKVPDYTIPLQERTMQLILTDTALKYYDNRRTAKVEVLRDMVLRSYQETVDSLNKQLKTIGLEWYKAKSTSVTHLTKLAPFSYKDLATGGWGNTVNAMKPNHGPSWRMVVQMGKEIEAYGVYPGGQSGNPGSPHYATYLQHWVDGKYYRLLFLPNTPAQSSTQITHTQSVSKN
jgi:penicillin amidase